MIRSIFLSFLVLIALPDCTPAAWGTGNCPPVGGSALRAPMSKLPAETPARRYVWKDSGDGDRYRLYDHNLEAATYRFSTDEFRWANGKLDTPPWGARSKPEAKVEVPNYGLITSELRTSGEHYEVNGQQVTRQQAQAAIGGPIPDDTGRKRISVIGGTEAERKRVTDDLASNPALSAWKDQTIVQSFAADAWQVRPGFVTTGHPSIYFQDAAGKVLMRADNYEGPEQLAGALRRSDPLYRPDLDPNGKPKPAPAPAVPGLPELPPWAWLGILGAGVVLLLPLSPGPEGPP